MLESPRWMYLREIFPAFDRGVFILEKISIYLKKIGRYIHAYLRTISLQKLPRNLVYGVFIVFLGYFTAFSVLWRLDNPGVRVTTILTGSMEPEIPTGSLIVTSPFDTYKIGDIITYRELHPTTQKETNRTLTHRVIATKQTDQGIVYIAQGDANRVPDINDIKNEHIYGKVLYTIPFVGYVYNFVSTLPGFILLIAIPAFLLIKNEIKYIRYNSIMNNLREESESGPSKVLYRR